MNVLKMWSLKLVNKQIVAQRQTHLNYLYVNSKKIHFATSQWEYNIQLIRRLHKVWT